MKFSIIVPVYNVKNYIEQTIYSFINQTYTDFEVILVDDGSTDGSGEKCDFFAQKYEGKVFCFHTINQGPYLAREYGIGHSTGDCCVFVDADDCVHKDMLNTLKLQFEKTCCDMIVFDAALDDNFSVPFRTPLFGDMDFFEGDGKKQIYEKLLLTSELNNICLKACKRSIFDKLSNNTIDKSIILKNGEDLLMSTHAIANAKSILYINKNLYYYRQRAGSSVHTFNINRTESIKYVHFEIEKYIELWEMDYIRPKYCARKVRGWIDSILLLTESKHQLGKNEYKALLDNLCNDSYFRTSFEAMDGTCLTSTYNKLAKNLYNKDYLLLELVVYIKKLKQKLRNIIKVI